MPVSSVVKFTIVFMLLITVCFVPVSAENFISFSQRINNSAYNLSLTSVPVGLVDASEAPDSAMTAESLNETAGTGGKYLTQNTFLITGQSTTLGQNYTYSVYMKPGSISIMQLSLGTGAFGSNSTINNRPYVNFNLTNCSIAKKINTTFAAATDAGNGWCRVSMGAQASDPAYSLGFNIMFTNNNPDAVRFPSYAGSALRNVYVWGLQSETGDTPTEYTATNETAEPPTGNQSFADFTVSRTTVGQGGRITFTDTSNETPTSWLWEFGDGNTSTTQSPSFIYNVPGTYSVNHWANNTVGGSWKNETDLITVDDWPDSWMNPYANMTPWIDQEDAGICSGASSAHAMMLLRYYALGTTPTETQEPYSRDVWFNWSSYTIKSDVHADYTPSPSAIYHDIYDVDPTLGITAIGNNLMSGYNLQTDHITPKSGTTEYFYPQTEEYTDNHKYNAISGFERYRFNTTANWTKAMEKTYRNKTVILHIDVYSNLHSAPSQTLLPEPTGAPAAVGHYVATVGYNRELNQLYFLHSYGNNEGHQKIGGITQTYWQYGGSKSEFIVPYGMTVDESLVPMGVTNLTNQTPGCSSVNISWTNPAHTDFNDTIIRANNVIKTRASNTTTFFNITGISGSTIISTNTCDFWNCNTTLVNITVTTPDCTPPEAISNLANTTTCNSVNITYDSPPDMDFNKTIWRQDNVIKAESGNTTTSIVFSGLLESTLYAFSGQSCDLVGNCNTTVYGNMSATTGTCNVPPVAAFTVSDTTACIGVAVQFTDQSSNAPDKWLWDFGEGNTSALQNPSYTYFIEGDMTINLTVNNTYGIDFERKVDYITVSNCTGTIPDTPQKPISVDGVFSTIAASVGLIVILLMVISAFALMRMFEGNADFNVAAIITVFATAIILIIAAVFIFATLYTAVSV